MNEIMIDMVEIEAASKKAQALIANCIARIEKRRGVRLVAEDLPLDDRAALSLFTRSATGGIFLFSSLAMRGWLRTLKPSCFEDITGMLATFQAGMLADHGEIAANWTRAAEFAALACRQAFLKAHYPNEFRWTRKEFKLAAVEG